MFMGGMPELMENIFKNLSKEFYSLYSCALIQGWIKLELENEYSYSDSDSESESESDSDSDSDSDLDSCSYYNESINRVTNSLIKLFVERGATLYKLDLRNYHNEIDLGHNKEFFSRLQDLSLDESHDDKYFRNLAKHATKISVLSFEFCSYPFYYSRKLKLFYALTSIIKSQKQLRRFKIVGDEYEYHTPIFTKFHGIISSLDSQKSSLQEVIIERCAHSTEFEALNNCKNLEILQSEVEMLKEPALLEAFESFGANIIYLNISKIEISKQLVELIGNLQKLQFFTLRCNENMQREKEPELQVMRFASRLPLTLQYLDLRGIWIKPYIDSLLNYCNASLKKLLIDSLHEEKNAKALIEFCKRKRTLKYVGLLERSCLDDNIRNELENYITLLPLESIVVDC
ncbi:hypothetical protein F8M41_001617 [Gigaspora margarita]|uniref:F-box domain-containing protein n=1 Tax=Gigaspora margarita TaxID=4874 RepID=A0A8H4AZ09_GIGMA|nr:hypothetical protein F8M41_001617 [Gigaspora margarita]